MTRHVNSVKSMLAVPEVFSVILICIMCLVSETFETKISIPPKMPCIYLKTKIDLDQTQNK